MFARRFRHAQEEALRGAFAKNELSEDALAALRRKMRATLPEMTEAQLQEEMDRSPGLLRLALMPEPPARDIFEKVVIAYIHETTGRALERLPREGRGAVYLLPDGNVGHGWRDLSSTRALDFRWTEGGSERTTYVYAHESCYLSGSVGNFYRDVRKFLTCAEAAAHRDESLRFVAWIEDPAIREELASEFAVPGVAVTSIESWTLMN